MDSISPRDLPALLGIPLSDEQIIAATAPLAPQLIVAGAGTGKTTVMAARVVWLVATKQVPPAGVLGLTFTNKAAAELRSRVRSALDRVRHRAVGAQQGDHGEATVLTYHSFAGKIVGEHGLLMGLEPSSAPLTDALRSRLAYRIACAPVVQPASVEHVVAKSPGRLAELVTKLDDALADLSITTAELRAFDAALLGAVADQERVTKLVAKIEQSSQSRLVLSELVDQFRAAKFAGDTQDFADQVRHADELALNHPTVGEQLRAEFPIVLLDEYQDTSRAQRRTIQHLFGHGHPVTAVGDPCQAIYGWRGASVTNIDEFPAHFPDRQGAEPTVAALRVNRRSKPNIVTLANKLATDLHQVHDHVKPLEPAQYPNQLTSRDAGELTCALHLTQDDEVSWLAGRVADLAQRRPAEEIAVLCRTNDQIMTMALALQNAGVPCHVAAKQALLQLPQVRELLHYLEVLVDPMANAAVVAILSGPRYRIGPRDLSLLSQRGRALARGYWPPEAEPPAQGSAYSLLDAVFDMGGGAYSKEARERVAQFAHLIVSLRRWQLRPVVEIVDWLIDRLGMPALWLDNALGEVDAAAVADFLALVRDFADLDGQSDLPGFLAYVRDCERFGDQPRVEQPAPAGKVVLMTVHGAKGLEFPVVALPFLTEGSFPAAKGKSRWPTHAGAVPTVIAGEPDAAALVGFPDRCADGPTHDAFVAEARAEERLDEDRLAYVAVTRAKDMLIASGHWWGQSQTRPRGASDYLKTIRELCGQVGGEIAHWEPAPDADAVSPVLHSPARAVRWPPPGAEPRPAGIAALFSESTRDLAPQESVSHREPLHSLLAETDPVCSPDSWADRVEELLAYLSRGQDVTAAEKRVVSATSLINKHKDPVGFAQAQRRPMPRKPSAAAAAGTEFHNWVEDRLGQQSLFDFDGTGATTSNLTPELHDLQKAFTGTEFAERAPIAVEHPFTIRLAGHIVTGQI
ncbi:MAG: ATP-dependent helicase, partial [Actinomycetia bacterium]|nr:ATP-dependent helicase [Actinomycetes bacterium]